LTGATESPGTSYAYAYDLAGNRTEVWENGVQTQSQSYNAAIQVIGWSYDAAGNLLSDGTHTSAYDALSRQVSRDGINYSYNGDGTLVQAGATAYTLDLAAPLSHTNLNCEFRISIPILADTNATSRLVTCHLSLVTWYQVLHDGTSSYVYVNRAERLRAVGGAWYIPDALGSVRATLDGAGTVLASTSYDPWGLPQASAIAPFGFTGEVQDAAGMVYLRARWYDAGSGRFGGRDPFAGWPETPYSQHYYQYGYSDPVRLTDPSGACVGGRIGNLDCTVLDFQHLTWGEREAWMIDFAQSLDYGGWFRNIEDIIVYFSESQILDRSLDGWASWSDAGVLEVIQDGQVLFERNQPAHAGDETPSARRLRKRASSAWHAFFQKYDVDRENITELKPLWAVAEQAGVEYGIQVAEDRLTIAQSSKELLLIDAFVFAGDAYRSIASEPDGGWKVGSIIGNGTVRNATAYMRLRGIPTVNPIWEARLAGVACGVGGVFGEWFTTPASRLGTGRGPTYYSAWAVEHAVGAVP
jgi:RHS repeat-associated protein